MNYCTFLRSIILSQVLKIVNIMNLFLCTMCITIELWSSVEESSKGATPFCGFGYSFIGKPQDGSVFYLLLHQTFVRWVNAGVLAKDLPG